MKTGKDDMQWWVKINYSEVKLIDIILVVGISMQFSWSWKYNKSVILILNIVDW